MQEPKRCLKQTDQVTSCNGRRCFFHSVLRGEARLHQFDIPITEIAPKEIVDPVRGLVKTIGLPGVINVVGHPMKARSYPMIFESSCLEPGKARVGPGRSLP